MFLLGIFVQLSEVLHVPLHLFFSVGPPSFFLRVSVNLGLSFELQVIYRGLQAVHVFDPLVQLQIPSLTIVAISRHRLSFEAGQDASFQHLL